MNSDQLLKFVTVADSKTMTEAAEKLSITQSALSHSISELEEELDIKLFVREKKKLFLTAAGDGLLKYARTINALMDSAKTYISNSEKINIAAINVCASYMLNNYPDELLPNISLLSIGEDRMPQALRRELIDVAACDDFYMKSLTSKDLRKFLLCREQLVLAVPEGHRLYDKKKVRYSDLEDVPLCIRSDYQSLQTWISNVQLISGRKLELSFAMDQYTYLNIRDKIPYPEIRQLSSIYKNSYTPTLTNKPYKLVTIDDTYSSRFVYMWYMQDNFDKIQPLIDSVKRYYTNLGL